MSDEADDELASYGLVMPFVTCASKGGPHDDNSYVAGWEMGRLDVTLAGLPEGVEAYDPPMAFRSDNAPQVDLVAMRHRFIALVDDTEVEGWVSVQFRRQGS